jgi:ribosomal protein S18 acetylase RimI-like enzyme
MPKDALPSKDLRALCFQTHPSFRGQGIATALVRRLIEWAEANGWENIRARAAQHIEPLLDWCGMWSVERYRRMGFQVTGGTPSEELKQGVVAMRGGHHGEEVKTQWEQYSRISDDEASMVYDVVLPIRRDTVTEG